VILEKTTGPPAICLFTGQNVPDVRPRHSSPRREADRARRLRDGRTAPTWILIGTGSEVQIAVGGAGTAAPAEGDLGAGLCPWPVGWKWFQGARTLPTRRRLLPAANGGLRVSGSESEGGHHPLRGKVARRRRRASRSGRPTTTARFRVRGRALPRSSAVTAEARRGPPHGRPSHGRPSRRRGPKRGPPPRPEHKLRRKERGQHDWTYSASLPRPGYRSGLDDISREVGLAHRQTWRP